MRLVKGIKIIVVALIVSSLLLVSAFCTLAENSENNESGGLPIVSEDNTSSDDTSSDDTSSDDTSSDDTSSDDTSSDDTSNDNTSSDNTSSDDASSDNTSSDNTSSDNTSSDNTSSDNTSSDNTSSDNTSSDNTSSDNTSSGDTSSDNTSSGDTSSDNTSSEPDVDYGNEDNGLILGDGEYLEFPATDGLMNGSFEQGFKYWTTPSGKSPSEVVNLIKTDVNTYVELKGSDTSDAIVTPRLTCNVMPGQRLVLLYDWSGSDDFKIQLNQIIPRGQVVLAIRGDKIVAGSEASEWRTSMCNVVFAVAPSYNSDGKLYYTVSLAPGENPESLTLIDNIRLGIYNRNNNHVYDIYGNLIYDVNNPDKRPVDPVVNSQKQSKEEREKMNAMNTDEGGDDAYTILTIVLSVIFAVFGLAVMVFVVYKILKKSPTKKKEKVDKPTENQQFGFVFEEDDAPQDTEAKEETEVQEDISSDSEGK